MARLSDDDYLRIAYLTALSSDDPSTQNGAVVVSAEGKILGRGFNRFVKGVPRDASRVRDRDYKYPRSSHAEMLAVLDAFRNGHAEELPGATLYCPWYACCDCSKVILEAGIREVVGHANHPGNKAAHSSWPDAVRAGLTNLTEAGVSCRYLVATLCNPGIRVNYELWRP